MLFVKYLNDVNDDTEEEYLKKYNGDQERTKRAMRHERFIVPEHSHFKYLYDNRNAVNIGELIDIALVDLEEANRQRLYSEDGAGIFKNISFNSSVLGEPKDKNTRLKNLLLDFNKPELDLRPSHLSGVDIIGGAYEYLIFNFASDAGKKAGEFFTPSEVSTLMAKLTKSVPGSRICDPTGGSGSLLIKAGQENGLHFYFSEFDSSASQFMFTSLYKKGKSFIKADLNSEFSKENRNKYKTMAKEYNKERKGDQVCLYYKKIE